MSLSFGSTSTPNTGFGFGTQNAPLGFTFGPPTEAPKEAATATSKTKAKKANTLAATPTPRPASLADGVEGVVEFPSRGHTSYRFEIVAKDGKLHIWLEDRKTKKQWRTAQLALEDFVPEGLVIPQATFDDYAKCFLSCLESATANADFARDLVAAGDVADAWELQLTLQIRVFTTTWKPMYSFLLKPVPLGPVDLLTAKIRDQEELIADLQRQVKSLTAQRERDGQPAVQPPLFVRGTLDRNVGCGKLVWKPDEQASSSKILFNSNGLIRFTVGGTFVVNTTIQHTNANNSTAVELLLNGKSVVACVDSSSDRHIHTCPIYHVLTVAPEDELSVMYRGNNNAYAGSFIVIHELR